MVDTEFTMQAAIKLITQHQHLSEQQMTAAMRMIMTGKATDAQIGGFLIGLQMKGETITEIAAAASVMRELATPVYVTGEHVIDTCGTGGDGASSFNVSTASAFVVAAAGAKVAKHGNRSVSSTSGSADVLETAGVNLELTPEQVAHCVETTGVGFMFAQRHHGAMKHTVGPRREMGVRTIFNLLGPLTNPAKAKHQVMGVFDKKWVEPIAQVLQKLGSKHVMVVHAEDGMDEISIGADTFVAELKDGVISTYTIKPEDFVMQRTDISQLTVSNAQQSLDIIKHVFAGEPGPARDIVVLNAGAAIYTADLADSLAEGVRQAKHFIDNGIAHQKLDALITCSQL
ncbi:MULTISPECIES: anthranilate phosphoribosyltransferase [unclassified Methylophaga]|uniref:anthranilate phosphoribosyltransferase n=1 Tax=unclassified Methylophaga TaxID=2629249 RepID=UPI000C8FF16C|nr:MULTISPECIES: anthranilate phosphoribosyltransferase [unclassified Methylophaga]MBN45062.1 anthranilate phosphoribosyltransferase [Methylophaga sp.]